MFKNLDAALCDLSSLDKRRSQMRYMLSLLVRIVTAIDIVFYQGYIQLQRLPM